MKQPLSPEQIAARWRLGIKVGIFLIVGVIVGPWVGLALKGIAGIIAAGAIMLTSIAVAPVLGSKMANWKLKALKAEAAKNPVETLQNEYRRRQGLLAVKIKEIETFEGKLLTFKGKLGKFKKQYPVEAPKFEQTMTGMQQLLDLRKEKYLEAKRGLSEFGAEIEKADAIWQMGQAAADATEGSGMNEEDFYARLKVETSLESVEQSMNLAFAQLETSLLENKETKALNASRRELVHQTA